MKIKSALAFIAIFIAALGLQWVSGVPFDRNPGEAQWIGGTLLFATWAAWMVWLFR